MTSDSREPTTEGYGTYETTQKAASYVTEIMENEARLAAMPRVSPKRRKQGNRAFAFVVPVFVLLTAMNMISARKAIPVLTPGQAKQEAQIEIYLAIQQVEAYKSRNNGELPRTLEEVGADAPGLVFVREAQGYEIVAEVGGTQERYRHGDDPSRFEAAALTLFENQEGAR